MPLPIVPAPMTTTALSFGSASAIGGLRLLQRRALAQPGLPVGQAGCDGPPAEGVEAVVEVAQRADDGHVADSERCLGQRLRLVVELAQGCACLQIEGVDQRLQR